MESECALDGCAPHYATSTKKRPSLPLTIRQPRVSWSSGYSRRLRNWVSYQDSAALGVSLLLWHEFTGLAGRPVGVALALFAAAVWALGTQLLRRTKADVATLTLSFWMTVIVGVVNTPARLAGLGAAAVVLSWRTRRLRSVFRC